MNFLMFSGPGGAGKTPSILRYKEYLMKVLNYSESELNSRGTDFDSILKKGEGRKIIVCSDTDIIACIDNLVYLIGKHPDAEAVITSCKSFDVWPRQEQFNRLQLNDPSKFFFEIPMGRQVTGGRRNASLGWYLASILEIAKLAGSNPPFNF